MDTPAPNAPPQAASASAIMSPSEVEKLLDLAGAHAVTGRAPVDTGPGIGRGAPGHHDFPRVSSLPPGQMRKVRMRCEDFARALASRLSVHFRMESALQIIHIETVPFAQFTKGLSNPTHLSLFQLDPLKGIALLDIPPRLAHSIVDRELGGPGDCPEELRDLTPMESKLAGRVVTVILNEWCAVWAGVLQTRPVILGCESSASFLQTHPGGTLMFTLKLEARLAQIVEQIQIAFPHSVLEPLVQKINAEMETPGKPEGSQPQAVKWNRAFDEVPVRLTAIWHGIEISAGKLASLKPGDFVPLAPDASRQVELVVESKPKFAGQLGACGRQMAVKITGAL